jgi:hypothetical protein
MKKKNGGSNLEVCGSKMEIKTLNYFINKLIIWRNNVKEIIMDSGEIVNSFDKLKDTTYKHYVDLYIERGG